MIFLLYFEEPLKYAEIIFHVIGTLSEKTAPQNKLLSNDREPEQQQASQELKADISQPPVPRYLDP